MKTAYVSRSFLVVVSWLAGVGAVSLLVAGPAGAGVVSLESGGPAKPSNVTKARQDAGYGKLPLHFEANRGQTDARVRFLSRGPG